MRPNASPFLSARRQFPASKRWAARAGRNTSAAITDCTSGCSIANTTTYYHEDQINSSRLISDGYGYPIWQATYLPYGEEYGLQIGANHYKFSGKERDSESGLDYFGARYYGSALGRWLTTDWAAKATAVPYAEFADPQSLNLYSYVRNIPSVKTDVDGHGCGEMPCDMVDISGAVADAAKAVWHFLTSGPPGPAHLHSPLGHSLPAPQCPCPETGSQNNNSNSNSKDNNNSYQTNTKADQLKANAAQGKAAEQAAEKTLTDEGKQVVGKQVGVRTDQGLRRVDLVTKDSAGNIVNNEVKSGNATRSAAQIAKDNEIANQGGTYVGKNAPSDMRGQTLKVPTEVRHVDPQQ